MMNIDTEQRMVVALVALHAIVVGREAATPPLSMWVTTAFALADEFLKQSRVP